MARILTSAVALVLLAALAAVVYGQTPPMYPPEIKLPATFRDFPLSHPDFQYVIAAECGIVMDELGPDRKPVFRGGLGVVTPPTGQYLGVACTAGGASTTHDQTLFSEWFRDSPDQASIRYDTVITLVQDPPGSTTYKVEFTGGNQFFPINQRGWGNDVSPTTQNFFFTLEMHTVFLYTGVEVFNFQGDDDVWVFINDKLVVDIGGVHGAISKQLTLSDVATAVGLEIGMPANFSMFFAERHTTQSNIIIETSIVFQNVAPLALDDEYTVQVGDSLDLSMRARDDNQDPLTFALQDPPADNLGSIIQVTDGEPALVYTAPTDATGVDTFEFIANDGQEDSNIGTITITIIDDEGALNRLPAAAVAGVISGVVLAVVAVGGIIAYVCYVSKNVDQWIEEASFGNTEDVKSSPLYMDPTEGGQNPLYVEMDG